MKIDLKPIAKAIAAAAKTVLDKIVNLCSDLVAFPFRLGQAAVGLGPAQRIPEQPPVFETPVSLTDLVAELNNGHARSAVIRDMDRDGVTQVFRLASLAKISKDKRAEADLSSVERKDVQALLIRMTPSELEALTKAGSGAVRRLLVDGDAKVWGVPCVNDDLAEKLRALKEQMAKPAGSRPYKMPKM